MKWITYADENYQELSDLTLPEMSKHCAANEIEFKRFSKPINPALDVYWNRVPMLEFELPGSGFTVWSDADILYTKAFDWKSYVSESPNVNIWVSSASNLQRRDVCCGFLIFRECPWSFEFLRAWKFAGPMREEKVGYYADWNRHDQEAFNILYDWFRQVREKIFLLPENLIANPSSSQVDKDACAGFHYWGAAYKQEALRQIKERLSGGLTE